MGFPARERDDVEAIRAQAKIQAAALSDIFDTHIHEVATKGDLREIKEDITKLFFLIKLILGVTVIMSASVFYMVFFDM